MRACGKEMPRRDRAKRCGKMDHSMKAPTNREARMDTVSTDGPTVAASRANGLTMRLVGLATINGRMEDHTRDTSKIITCMGRVSRTGQMVDIIKEHSLMIRNRATASTIIQMADHIKASGKTECSMERVCSPARGATLELVSGRMERESVGPMVKIALL